MTYTYNIKIKVQPKSMFFKAQIISGIVVARNPKEAEDAAMFSAYRWVKEKNINADLKFMSIKNIRANDFFIDAKKVNQWKQSSKENL